MRLEPGEELSDECLAADVYFGDEKVAPSAVSAVLQPGAGGEHILKVSTTALINEPVVTVYLAAGCHARMTRKFVAFADPPGMVMPSAGEAPTESNVAEANERADKTPTLAAATRKTRAPSASRLASGAKSSKGNRSKPSPGPAAVEVASRDELPVMSGKAARVAPESGGDVRPSQRSELRAEQSLGQAKRSEASESGGRLVLDGVDADRLELPDLRMTSSMGIMLQAEDQSPAVMARRRTAAAMWQALNATPEEMARDRQRMVDLEQRFAQLTAENQRNRKALAEASGLGGSGKWLALLGLIALVAVGVAVYLARQLKSGRKGKEAWWHSQTDAQLREPGGDAASGLERTAAFVREPAMAAEPAAGDKKAAASKSGMAPPPAVFSAPLAKSKLHDAVPDAPATPIVATSAPAALVSQAAEPLREVSVEELIDLEQQAEFFVVLGQDDAAISLLESHVTHTTGASPLPFLKLLEIHRRLDRRADYERVQAQFNERFNAHAPSWDADLQHGHTLEDYPGVAERLQALWATPAKAMEVLEKSLTRPDSSVDTFDLPAYRELLFLYAVARDLSERQVHERANVDVLLPALDVGSVDELDGGPTTASNASEPQDNGEPLMATRPIKAQPEAMPSLNLDFHLDEMPESSSDTVKH